MENPFRKLDKPLKPVPPELRAKVMNDIATAKLLMEMASLFSLNIAEVIESTMKQRKNKTN
ncbi:MAG: hypothetical protein R2797_08560 [Gelidibacter sp.]